VLDKEKIGLTCWIVGLPLLVTVFVPRSAGFNNPFFIYGAIGAVISLALLGLSVQRTGIGRDVFVVWGWLGLIVLVTTCSQLLNTPELYASGVTRIFRPFLYAVVVAYGYKVGVQKREGNIRSGLLWAAYVIIAGQVVVGFPQLIGLEVFDLLYTSTKASPVYEIFRVTGTMGNPNFFGWVLLQVVTIITLLNREAYPYLLVALCSVLIVASGSRTTTLMLPFVLILTQAFRQGTQIRMGKLLMNSTLLLMGAVGLFLAFSDYVPYIAQIRKIFLTGSLNAITSLEGRFIHWADVAERFFKGNWAVWLFGLSDRSGTQVLDNNYLFVFFRTGLTGLIIHLIYTFYITLYCCRRRRSEIAQICIVYVLSALVMGMVADTLASWFVPIWLMYYLGLVIGTEGARR